MVIKWLHISDVHECDTDTVHRKAAHAEIVAEVQAQQVKPDFICFTGDLAGSGQKGEYELLKLSLLAPLRAVLPADCAIFMVPGNHDVDRKRAAKPRLWIDDDDERKAFQHVSAEGQRKRCDTLLPRFEAYRELEREFSAWDDDWLASEQGSICKIFEIGDRRIAIIGINKAWLCQDDKDWGHLTAGRYMVDAALKQADAENPDLLLVLGHHPLAAMTRDADHSDGNRIRTRLEAANAIYLHGHLHASGAQITGDSMQSVLAIQAPSGFQAADDRRWRNGLLWTEADLSSGKLIIKPKRWSDDYNEYKFDIEAARERFRVHNQDSFAFPLPGRAPTGTPVSDETTNVKTITPDGWEIIDAKSLADKTTKRPSAKEMSDWFDGHFPRWEVALAEDVRPRWIVEDIARRFETAHKGAPQPLAVLLTGAGGEGKSAALLQIAAKLVQGKQNWTCVWRSATAATLPEDLFTKFQRRPNHAWIIAIDDAESMGQALQQALLCIQPRTDVHLILAARDADWSVRGLTDSMWRGVAAFSRVTLAGLDAEDARRIADGWVAYGNEAMGRMHHRTAEQVALALLGHAQEQAAKKEEGALLGALLITRAGEDLKNRVVRLMEPWANADGIGVHSLLDVYAIIAAMHAENQLYLSRATLALTLDCDEAALDRGPLRVLRREAMVDGGTTYVLTRHRRIAETARDWLVETGHDVDKLYVLLARAAERSVVKKGPFNPDISKWRSDLTWHFVDRGRERWPVAVMVAKALFEANPNAHLLTNYASTLRRTEQAVEALALLRNEASKFQQDRGLLYEWSVTARKAGEGGLAVWLAARSLADSKGQSLTANQIKLSLAGTGAAFRELQQAPIARVSFAPAQAVCGRLGLKLQELNTAERGVFEKYFAAMPSHTDTLPSIEADLETLRRAVVEASYESTESKDQPFFENLIDDPETYRFTSLRSVLSGNDVPRTESRGRQGAAR